MSLTRTQLMIIGGALLAITLFIGIFVYLIPYLSKGDAEEPTAPITLTVWGVDDASNFIDIFSQYTAAHPLVSFNYTQVPEARYEKALLNAMATDQTPDIFMIHRSWASRYNDKIVSAEQDQITPAQLRELFPDIVYRDFVSQGYVAALPLYIDSLALFYNKDTFDKKGVAVTPKTWGDIKTLTPYFAKFVPSTQLQEAAIALGGSDRSIANAADIMSLFMFQFGSKSIENSGGQFSLDASAERGVEYYAQFSSPANPAYTWNDSFGTANDSFGSGITAMSLNYSREIPSLTKKNPYLNLGIAPLPQNDLSNPINYADYWGLAVSIKGPNIRHAWNFVIAATTDPAFATTYQRQSGTPPALRTSINEALSDPVKGIFARQALTAHAPFQYDNAAYRKALSDSMRAVLNGTFDIKTALSKAATEINSSY